MKTIIHFADHGQDFLDWTLDENGVIVACDPFQGWLWLGAKVMNQPEIGKLVVINRTGHVTTPLVIKYPVVKIELVADEVAA